MNHFCTHSDKNYLAKGITLYRSLFDQNPNLTLWYLCTDEETFEKLVRLNLPGIVPISLSELEEFDPLLSAARNNPASMFGNEYSQFCWTLTPYFTWWLLQKKIPKDAELLYCDADLCFYSNPSIISEVCATYSCGIHQHRFTGVYDVEKNPVGEFNVGCVFFRNDVRGRNIAENWKSWLLNPENEYYKQYGTCGDQKYLDLFIPKFGSTNVRIFDYNTGPIAHGAPWNYNIYEFIKNSNQVRYNGTYQSLLFNHFSHFTANFENNSWSSSDHGEWAPEKNSPFVMAYYERYWSDLKISQEMINNI